MIGVLLITHNELAQSLLGCAHHILGKLPATVRCLAVGANDNVDELYLQATGLLMAIRRDLGTSPNNHPPNGIVVLTDMLGATPSNIATRLLGENVAGIAGVSLPMLIRLLSYTHLPLQQAVDKALSGGQEGIVRL